MDTMLSCGQWMKQRRLALDLTQDDLAQRISCSRMTVKLIEAGRRRPSKHLAALLAAALDVPLLEREAFVRWARGAPDLRWAPPPAAAPDEAPTAAAAAPSPSAATLNCHQLHAPTADFVGRSAVISRLLAAMQPHGPATIAGVSGMGGIGKTELAYVVAHRLSGSFPHVQIVLSLRGSHSDPLTPVQALQSIIRALIPDASLSDELPILEQSYRSILHSRRALILADDAKDAAQVRPLIPPAGSALLVTSRRRFTLPGMISVNLEQLSEVESVDLLGLICPRLDVDERRAIARGCGYLPLALRVSGGILHNNPALSAAAYMRRLADERERLAYLRDPDDAQLDVAASLTMSYAQLDGVAQQAFRELGVLAADFELGLAEAVVTPPPGAALADLLHLLLRRNLVMYDQRQGRWRLHDLVRDIARHYLKGAGAWDATMWRYAGASVRLAQDVCAQYGAGGGASRAALARFDRERRHIDAALAWATAHAGASTSDALLVAAVTATACISSLRYGRRHERIPHLEAALHAARRAGDRFGEAQVLNELGAIYGSLGDARQAVTYFEQRRAIARELGDRDGEAGALNNLGISCAELGDIRQAMAYYEQALSIDRERHNQRGEAATRCNLGQAALSIGDLPRALSNLEHALVIFRACGSQSGEAEVMRSLGRASAELGDTQRGIALCQQALASARTVGDRYREGRTLCELGWIHTLVGQAPQAIAICTEVLAIVRDTGDRRSEGAALRVLGEAHAFCRDYARATAAFKQALAIFESLGDHCGAAECRWSFGLSLSAYGDHAQALLLMRASVAHALRIGHMQAAARAATLARLENGKAVMVGGEAPELREPRGSE